MNGLYYTITIYGAIGILFFIAQLFLCYRAKRKAVMCIPIYLILFCTILTTLLAVGVFGTGFLNAERIVAFLLFIGIGAASIGSLIAWATYGIHKGK